MINGTDTAAAKVETCSKSVDDYADDTRRLGQQGLEEKECSPEEWKFFFPPGEGMCIPPNGISQPVSFIIHVSLQTITSSGI